MGITQQTHICCSQQMPTMLVSPGSPLPSSTSRAQQPCDKRGTSTCLPRNLETTAPEPSDPSSWESCFRTHMTQEHSTLAQAPINLILLVEIMAKPPRDHGCDVSLVYARCRYRYSNHSRYTSRLSRTTSVKVTCSRRHSGDTSGKSGPGSCATTSGKAGRRKLSQKVYAWAPEV